MDFYHGFHGLFDLGMFFPPLEIGEGLGVRSDVIEGSVTQPLT